MFEPTPERLADVAIPTGATLLVDTRKATPSTLQPALDALAGIPARRRIAVIGSLWYFDTPPDEAHRATVAAARAVADEVVYAPDAPGAVAALRGDERVRVIPSIAEIARLAREDTRPRDVVLVKGTYVTDHLYRLALQLDHDVRCWRDDCTKRLTCTRCRHLARPHA